MASSTWRNEYMQALKERDTKEKGGYERIDDDLIEAFTQLLAHTAALQAQVDSVHSSTPESKPRDPAINTQSTTLSSPESDFQTKKDLAEALRSNTKLQTRLQAAEAELASLKMKTTGDARSIRDITRERDAVSRRLKDKEDELRQKTKMFNDAQDEMISLNLQLNMSEQNAKRVKAENKELIERWLIHKGQEAEAMNHSLERQSPGR
ncbi:autophagy-related protein 16 [Tricladium varicosporioides]|nr:autophagy-related protein 16 [Hymenoscyphus varicosporioides]